MEDDYADRLKVGRVVVDGNLRRFDGPRHGVVPCWL